MRENTDTTWRKDVYHKYYALLGNNIDASSYAKFIPYGKYIIRRCFPSDKQIEILDIGCGIGGFIKVCIDSGYSNIRGIDISSENVTLAHKAGIQQVEQGDIFETLHKTGDNSLDIVLCLDVLEHFLRDDVIRILGEVHRALRPTGQIILHVPNAEGIFGSKVRYADYTHEQAFTCNSLGQILRLTGFKEIACYEDRPIVHGLTSLIRRILWTLFTLSFRILHAVETGSFDVKLSQNILAVGKKT